MGGGWDETFRLFSIGAGPVRFLLKQDVHSLGSTGLSLVFRISMAFAGKIGKIPPVLPNWKENLGRNPLANYAFGGPLKFEKKHFRK